MKLTLRPNVIHLAEIADRRREECKKQHPANAEVIDLNKWKEETK